MLDPGWGAAAWGNCPPKAQPVQPPSLHAAAQEGDVATLRALLAAGVDVDSKDDVRTVLALVRWLRLTPPLVAVALRRAAQR